MCDSSHLILCLSLKISELKRSLILWPPAGKSWFTRKDPGAEKDGRQRRRGWERMRWFHWNTDSTDMNLSKPQGASEGHRSRACCSPWGWKESDTTYNNTKDKSDRNKYCMLSLICAIWKIQQTSEYKNKSRLTDIENNLVVTHWGEKREEGT